MLEGKLHKAIASEWWEPLQQTSLRNAGLVLAGKNAFTECTNEFGPTDEISNEMLESLGNKYAELESWIPQLESRMAEVASFRIPKSMIETGLFDWARHALTAQFVFAGASFNAWTYWLKSCLGVYPKQEGYNFYYQNIYQNFEFCQHLPRTLDLMTTTKEWAPQHLTDKQGALDDIAWAERLSKLVEAKFGKQVSIEVQYRKPFPEGFPADFTGNLLINSNGTCSMKNSALHLQNESLTDWQIFSSNNGSKGISIFVSPILFSVVRVDDFGRALDFLTENLLHKKIE